MKVFLGGTCGESTWRNEVIQLLEAASIEYFNPVVEDWTSECQVEEERQKDDICDIHLYVITSEMEGVYSIAEAVNSAYAIGKTCLFMVNPVGFQESQIKSLIATQNLIAKAGGFINLGQDFSWIPLTLKRQNSSNQYTQKKLRHVEEAILDMDSPLKKFIKINNAEDVKGVPPEVAFTIQSDPVGEVGVNGCQAQDIIEYAKCLIQSFNSRFPCRENALTITKLEEALFWQEYRTKNRVKAGVEGVNRIH